MDPPVGLGGAAAAIVDVAPAVTAPALAAAAPAVAALLLAAAPGAVDPAAGPASIAASFSALSFSINLAAASDDDGAGAGAGGGNGAGTGTGAGAGAGGGTTTAWGAEITGSGLVAAIPWEVWAVVLAILPPTPPLLMIGLNPLNVGPFHLTEKSGTFLEYSLLLVKAHNNPRPAIVKDNPLTITSVLSEGGVGGVASTEVVSGGGL